VSLALRLRNRALNLSEYREGRVRLASHPRYVMVELTRGCNLSCPMCRKRRVGFREQTMRAEVFAKVSAELFESAEMIDLRGWGESLVLPEFAECMRAAEISGAQTRVVTNLSFRQPAVLKALAAAGTHVTVSLDSAEPSVLAGLRPGAHLPLIEENLKTLSARYREIWGSAERLTILCTVQLPALAGLYKLAELAWECGVGEVRLAAVSVPAGSPLALCEAPRRVDQALSELAHACRRRGIAVVVTTQLGSMPENGGIIPPCIRPWAYVAVNYEGRLGFCDHLIGPVGDRFILGDLRTTPLQEIWNGVAWMELRREHVGRRDASGPNFSRCSRCYRHRYVEFEDVLVPEAAERRVYL